MRPGIFMCLFSLFRLLSELFYQSFEFASGEGEPRLLCRVDDVFAQGFGIGRQSLPVFPQMALDYGKSHIVIPV